MNIKMNVIKALAIIGVVMVHAGYDVFTYLPSWRIPMFVFLSGYFFKERYVNEIKTYIWKKIKNLLLPMFGWHLFYGIITTGLLCLGMIKFGQKLSLKSLVIESFLHGHQYVFSLSLWFVIILFLIQVTYIAIRSFTKFSPCIDWILLIIFSVINFGGVYLSQHGSKDIFYPNLFLPLLRCMFLLVFFHLGYLYRKYIEPCDDFSFVKLLIPFIINIVLLTFVNKKVEIFHIQFRGVYLIVNSYGFI